MNRVDASKTQIGTLKISQIVTRCRDLKDKNALLQSRMLFAKTELEMCVLYSTCNLRNLCQLKTLLKHRRGMAELVPVLSIETSKIAFDSLIFLIQVRMIM